MTFLAGFAAGAACAAAVAAWRWRRVRATLGRFFSFAAHELNTPATAINMTILNLASGVFGEVPAEQLQWLEMTREQLGRLNGIVGELRDFIHMEFQRDLAIRLEDADAAEAVEHAIKALKTGSDHARIDLGSEIEPGLPAVRADGDRLARSLATLLFHARKFRASGAIKLFARKTADAFVEFSVEFSGQKVSADEAARSLELFYPARLRATHSMTATGLGLGIVRELARRQGGDLELRLSGADLQTLALRLPAAGQGAAKVVR